MKELRAKHLPKMASLVNLILLLIFVMVSYYLEYKIHTNNHKISVNITMYIFDILLKQLNIETNITFQFPFVSVNL